MKMQPMAALKTFSYGGKTIKKGRTFEAHPSHVRYLTALKSAQIDPAGPSEKAVQAPAEERPMKEVVTEALGVQSEVKTPDWTEWSEERSLPARTKRSYTRRTSTERG